MTPRACYILRAGMPPTREQEVDIAYALEAVPSVVGAYALALPASAVAHVDAHPFGVLLRPYTGESLAAAHLTLLDASSYEVTAWVAYADADCSLSRLFGGGRRLTVEAAERDGARSRFVERSSENIRKRRLEAVAMADAFERSFRAGDFGTEVRLSLKSGEFDLLPDPFPTEKLPPATVLVLDDGPGTAEVVSQLGEVELVTAKEIWVALALATERSFDLVLCARTFDERPAEAISTMLSSARRELIGRIVLLGREDDVLGPSSRAPARSGVLTRPLTSDIVRRLLRRLRK